MNCKVSKRVFWAVILAMSLGLALFVQNELTDVRKAVVAEVGKTVVDETVDETIVDETIVDETIVDAVSVRESPSSTSLSKPSKKVKEVFILKLPTAGCEEGESCAMTESMICACAKCGSSSFYMSLYKVAFGEDWPYSNEPWIQVLTSRRWKGVADVAPGDYDMIPQNSFALIRDPKERLLSAFRSKVTCDSHNRVDIGGRKRFVPQLLELAGLLPLERYGLQAPPVHRLGGEDAGLCLNRTTYLQALGEVWRSGREAKLNGHFLPQTHRCFLNLPPSEWKVVATIGRPGALCDLESVVRGAVISRNGTAARDSEDCSFPKHHSTKKDENEKLSEEEEMILDEITRKEYEVLGPYL